MLESSVNSERTGVMANLEVIVPIIVAVVVGTFGIIQTIISRKENKPVRDVLKRTKIEGDGSLVEAIGVLSKEYQNSQARHKEEIKYFIEQLAAARAEVSDLRMTISLQNSEIADLKKKLVEHEARLDESHIGANK